MSAYESRETIPEATLSEITGPAKRYTIEWYALPKLEGISAHHERSETWLAIYGSLAGRIKVTVEAKR